MNKTIGSTNERNRENVLSLLGLARRAGQVLVGQDRVLGAHRGKLVIVVSSDCSKAVMRKAVARGSGSVCFTLNGVTREELGGALGVGGAQIAALDAEGGFAKKLIELFKQGGVA